MTFPGPSPCRRPPQCLRQDENFQLDGELDWNAGSVERGPVARVARVASLWPVRS